MIDSNDRPVYGAIHAPPEPVSPSPRRGSAVPWLIAAVAFAFALGLITNPWFDRHVRSRLPGATPPAAADASRELAALQARLRVLESRAATVRRPVVTGAVSAPLDGEGSASVEARLAELQSQVAELRAHTDSSIAAAAEDAERAQTALLVGALRRAMDSGEHFDAYEPALRARFGATHPTEVAALLALARHPVAAEQLGRALAAQAPAVERAEAEGQSWWSSLKTNLAGIVAVRRADVPAVDPQSQLRAAATRAGAGDVEGALRLVAALPPAARTALGPWIADARRYAAATQALASLEVAALAPTATPVPAPASL